jgi:outer membrane protein assembly factor BamB
MRLAPAVVAISLLVVRAATLSGQEASASDIAWQYTSPGPIQWFCLCSGGRAIVATDSVLTALDAAGGSKAWQLKDLPNLSAGLFLGPNDSVPGMSYQKDKLVVFDMATGTPIWAQDSLPAEERILAYYRLARRDLLLLFLQPPKKSGSKTPILAAMRLSTGEKLWQRNDIFAQPLKFGGEGGVSDITTYQRLILDSDSTVLIYLTRDGPIRLDTRSGATLWQGKALAGRPVPSMNETEPYAGMMVYDSVLVVPTAEHLLALDTRDGHLVWEQSADYPKRPSYLDRPTAGILVKTGSAYVTVVDPATGKARWSRPLTVEISGAAYELTEDRYFVVSGDRLLSALLATGDTTGLANLTFGGGEHALQVFRIGEHLVIASRQNVAVADLEGHVTYQRYVKAPGVSFLQQFAAGLMGMQYAPNSRYGSADMTALYSYFFTDEPDRAGRKGYSIVRLKLEDGVEAGRVWVSEKGTSYRIDTERSQVLVKSADNTLVAMRFHE